MQILLKESKILKVSHFNLLYLLSRLGAAAWVRRRLQGDGLPEELSLPGRPGRLGPGGGARPPALRQLRLPPARPRDQGGDDRRYSQA